MAKPPKTKNKAGDDDAPMLACATCGTLMPLAWLTQNWYAVQLLDGTTIQEDLPYCSLECYRVADTPLKRRAHVQKQLHKLKMQETAPAKERKRIC